ncbi:MAG: transporter [Acidimicrobiales bacterium]
MTLRQFRSEALVGFGLLALCAVVLALTGPHLVQVNDAFRRACKAAGGCNTTPNPVLQDDLLLRAALPFLATVVPALIGIFFGAPLIARELETGTFRLAWTQSITLRRWLATKLLLIGLAAMVIGGLLTWMVDWWMRPVDQALSQDLFDPATFSIHGVAPIGYAAFAFTLGVATGVLLRRTVPAMAATLVGFVVARFAAEQWIRPNLATPLHKSLPFALSVSASTGTTSVASGVTIPNAWVLSTAVVDGSGHALTLPSIVNACPSLRRPPGALVHTCITKLGLHTVVTYQPARHFWPFQWAEAGIFLAGGLALCGLVYWWLRRQYM